MPCRPCGLFDTPLCRPMRLCHMFDVTHLMEFWIWIVLLVGSCWHHPLEEQELFCCHFGCSHGDMVSIRSGGIQFRHSCVSHIHCYFARYFHLVQCGFTSWTVTCSCTWWWVCNSFQKSMRIQVSLSFFIIQDKSTLHWKKLTKMKDRENSFGSLFFYTFNWREGKWVNVGWPCFSRFME